MTMLRRGLGVIGPALVAGLTGCVAPEIPLAPDAAPRPVPRAAPPENPPAPAPAPKPDPTPSRTAPAPAERSAALIARYKRMETRLRARGLLRTDGGGEDTPFTADMLARNFLQIALYDEYRRDGGTIRAEQSETRLRRWDRPVRIAVGHGEGVPANRRASDRGQVTAYAARLAGITGADIAIAPPAQANYHVLFLDEVDRKASAPLLDELVPGIDPLVKDALVDLSADTLCVVVAFSDGSGWAYSRAVAIIRDEHRGIFRRSCIHEEIAQGLGLANDSPRARPSIFNDDEEFALLTRHDALLLKMLYDPRLTSGMTLAEAEPIARQIAEELMGGES